MTENTNPVFALDLTLDAVNQILAVLGEGQYNKTAPLISAIMRQVQPQIERLQAEHAAAQEAAAQQQTEPAQA